MKKILLISLLSLYGNVELFAGDPCPMEFNFYDAGVAPWLKRDDILNKLESKEVWFGIYYENFKGGGIEVKRVYANSPAEKYGIEVGDIIYAVENKMVKVKSDFSSYFDNKVLNNKVVIKFKRGDKEMKKQVVLASRDPLLYKLKNYSPKSCSQSYLKELTKKEKEEIYKKVFSSSHRFECNVAHKKLVKMKKFEYNSGQLILIRGSKRVMLVEPQWGTTCIKSRDYDGKNLTNQQVEKLFDTIFSSYIEDRFENP